MNRPLLPSQCGRPLDRRRFLWEFGGGIGGIALASLLHEDALLAAPTLTGHPLASKPTHLPPRARQIIQIFCPGAISHIDTFDYKPELRKRQGMPFDPTGQLQFFASKPGHCQQSYWPFHQHGACGRWVSDLFPKLARCVDDMAFIYSMTNRSALHGPAMFMMNSGFILPGFPSMGAWITYGLGSENHNLPAFVVLPDARGVPPGGPANWGPGFLPSVYQGTALRTEPGAELISDLFPPADAPLSDDAEIASRRFLDRMNRFHQQNRPGDSDLLARISAYELAARLQLSAPEVTELTGESGAVRKLYGLDDPKTEAFGRQCLMARRLIERGVRFVQVFCGADNVAPPRPNWDAHENVYVNHGRHGPVLDTGAAALILDLKSRGLLEETLVICTTEFGRQPAAQGKGRDHNPGAFTTWLAGGGIRGGTAYGSSDPLGYQAVENPVQSYDLHATSLHLLGLNHEKLTYYHNGVQRRLTDVHGHVIDPLLA